MTDLSPAELDRQYNARAAIAEHPDILARWATASEQVRRQGGCEQDYYYGATPDETLDLFPARRANAPLLIFVHGGWWRALDKRDFSFLAPAFVGAGVSFAPINYSLAPKARIEDIVRQILRACAWCWRNARGLGADPQRIHIAGHSAGGHLAAMMLAADWPAWAPDLPPQLLRGGLAISGVYDLEPVARTPFLQPDLRLDPAAARRLSPLRYTPTPGVRLHTAVGAQESAEFHRQARLIRAAWPQCAGPHLTLDGCNHLTAVDALGAPGHPLHNGALRMLGQPPDRV